jgi:DNA-binding helix-hairpin-helix protein with protein kinase domain
MKSDAALNVLNRYDLASAEISGVGPELKNNLLRSGIRTAADFIDLKMTSYTYQNNPRTRVEFVLNSGRSIHIPGIGVQKGKAIKKWRSSIENKIVSIPTTLPAAEQQKINIQKQNKLRELNIRENTIKKECAFKESEFITKCKDQHDELKKQVESIKTQYDAENAKIEQKCFQSHAYLSEIRKQLNSKQIQIESYKNVNILAYIKGIFTFS